MTVHEKTPTRGAITTRGLFAPRSGPIKARAHAANTYGFPLRVNENICSLLPSTRTSPTYRVKGAVVVGVLCTECSYGLVNS